MIEAATSRSLPRSRRHRFRPTAGVRRQSFVAGIIVADYQGPALASFALALMHVTTRSERAHDRVTRATTWVMSHRRLLASWFGIVAGLALVADGVVSWLTA